MNQKISKRTRLLNPSGVNSSFHGGENSFQNYLQHMENVVRLGRIDLTHENANKIVTANSPFEWRPIQKTQKGVLLIHGLYDSCFSLRDIGHHLLKKNFLVRSILLPGHGTIPGDLLHVDHRAWIKAVNYAVDSLAQEVSDLYLVGFSMGGALATYYALQPKHSLRGLILIAPGLKPRRRFVKLGLFLHKMGEFFHESNKWYQIEPQNSYARYESFPCRTAEQGSYILQITRDLAKRKNLNIPIFMVLTKDDESIDSEAAMTFFNQQPNAKSRLLYYTNDKEYFKDPRIIIHNSYYPDQRVLNFAHTGLPMSPHNPHYGIQGDFKDFQHYHSKIPKNKEIYLGAITSENLKKYKIQRLSYNPDFEGMIHEIEKFLINTE